MLRLLIFSVLLSMALSFVESEFDFIFSGFESDKFETHLREHGFSEEKIRQILPEPVEPNRRDKKKNRAPKPLTKICAEIECAPRKKLNVSNCGFKASTFLSAKWVVTPVDPVNTLGFLNAYMRLFDYTLGANTGGVNVSRTAPAINTWRYNASGVITRGNIAFYIPSKLQHSPPAPTNPDVFLEHREEVLVYTRAFGKYGNATSPYVKKQLKHLDRAMEKANIMPVLGLFLQAVYTTVMHAAVLYKNRRRRVKKTGGGGVRRRGILPQRHTGHSNCT